MEELSRLKSRNQYGYQLEENGQLIRGEFVSFTNNNPYDHTAGDGFPTFPDPGQKVRLVSYDREIEGIFTGLDFEKTYLIIDDSLISTENEIGFTIQFEKEGKRHSLMPKELNHLKDQLNIYAIIILENDKYKAIPIGIIRRIELIETPTQEGRTALKGFAIGAAVDIAILIFAINNMTMTFH